MNTLYRYSIGPNPYPKDETQQWGTDRGRFPDLDSALHGLFLGHPFPTAITGRHENRFYPGVSLEGVPGWAVVQVWTTEPEAVKRWRPLHAEQLKSDKPGSHLDGLYPHDGSGAKMGLACEIHVGMISRFQIPQVAGLLTDGSTQQQTGAFSPAGRMALGFTPAARSSLMLRAFQAQLSRIGNQHELGEVREGIQETISRLNEGMRLMNSYCNGTNSLEHLRQGKRAPGSEPYHLFQTRVYIGEELGLIANLSDMDHRNMRQIEDWLMRCDRWKKLLPLEKCILVSRIRKEAKDYGDPFANAYHNHFNLESLIWIRDGENVWRFATDIKFEERIFPNEDDAPALVRGIQERIWINHYSPAEDRHRLRYGYHSTLGNSDEPKEKEHPGEMKEPVPVKWRDEIEYKTLQDFLDSEHYTPDIDRSIQIRASDAVRRNARESMPFAMLLQGLIDFKGVLNIPAGLDIFNPEEQRRFIKLVADFGGAIADSRNAQQFEKLTKVSALKPGDKIVGFQWGISREKYGHAAFWNIGGGKRGPFVFTVARIAKPGEDAPDPETRWQFSTDTIFVHHWQLSKRWVYRASEFTQKKGVAPIDDEFIPVDFPLSLAEKLLDDREWKRTHRWAVPLLAQWPELKKKAAEAKDEMPFDLKPKDVDEL